MVVVPPPTLSRVAVLPDATAECAATRRASEAFVVAADEVLLDLLNGVQRDTDHDQQRRAAEVELNLEHASDDRGQHADGGQIERTAEGEPVKHALDELGRLPARPNARNVAALLLDVVGHVVGPEGERRVEVGEEDDQQHEEAVVDPRARLKRPLERHPMTGNPGASVAGNDSSAPAKMGGMTPAPFTFIGK